MKFSPTFYKNPSGSIGKLTAHNTQGGDNFRRRGKPKIKQNNKTISVHQWMRIANEDWRNATGAQRANWDKYALGLRPKQNPTHPYQDLPRLLTLGPYQPTYINKGGQRIINPWGRQGLQYREWARRRNVKESDIYPDPPRPLSGHNAYTRAYMVSRNAGRTGKRLIKFKKLHKRQQSQQIPWLQLELADDGMVNARLTSPGNHYMKLIIYAGENTRMTINNYKSSYRDPNTRTITSGTPHNYLRLPRGIRHWFKIIRTSSKGQFPDPTHLYFDTEPPPLSRTWEVKPGVVAGGRKKPPIANPQIPIVPPPPDDDEMMEMMEEMEAMPMTDPDPLSAEQWSEWRAQNCTGFGSEASLCITMPPTDNPNRVTAFEVGWICH